MASAIVLEPDYLISPQSMGGASVYANAELYFWLNAIKDDPEDGKRVPGSDGITMDGHILLGNYANACLAEYAARGTRDARALAVEFFRRYAVDITKADPVKVWLTECQHEAANIARMLGTVLPGEHQIVGRDWQIEAPFYSPQYGLSASAGLQWWWN